MVRLLLNDSAVDSRGKEYTISSVQILGYKVHLVLEDDDGNEFEVRDGLTIRVPRHQLYCHPQAEVNMARVVDATHEWEARRRGGRPVL